MDQPGRGEQRIIEPEPVAAEEHVSAHLTGERCLEVEHFLLDQGVACLPHHGLEARPLELLRQHVRALYIEDDREACANPARQVAREQHQELVAEYGIPAFVHHADPVAVAVEPDSQLGLFPHDRGLQVARFSITVGSG